MYRSGKRNFHKFKDDVKVTICFDGTSQGRSPYRAEAVVREPGEQDAPRDPAEPGRRPESGIRAWNGFGLDWTWIGLGL